ncbi:helix-turn-helix domain-containing protein [Carboxylicivirga sp. RSCT41]|uniref:helix-turn-helix domain-containing protein n=1 Tax=Carboxylicivirga agarovorans TaxID=3417570 RepID=UPI003D32E8B0
MNETISIGVFDVIIFLGVIQGIFLSFMLLKKARHENQSKLLQGLLLLFLSLTILEELLNNTGYIVQVLPLSDFSEPMNFTFGPLFYLYCKEVINHDKSPKKWLHLLPAVFWLLYMTFYFIQPDALKYNSYLETKHPEWEYMNVDRIYPDDPLGLRNFVNEMTLIHFIVYIILSLSLIIRKIRVLKQSIVFPKNEVLRMLRNTMLHFLIIVLIFTGTKFYFGMDSDIGSYFIATYIAFMFFITSYQVMQRSSYFDTPHLFPELSFAKYQRSSLNEADKERILSKLRIILEEESYFKNNLVSLSGLAKSIHENKHHVSQVINEKYEKNFFELIAWYRVREASQILIGDKERKLTIEEIADRVGYNSKSSFNSAFKRYTGHTPSEFRQLNKDS